MITVLPTPAPAEQTGLTALDERLDQVDGLDARLEDLGLRDQLVILGSRTMDGHVAGDFGHGLLVNGSPMTFQMRPRVS